MIGRILAAALALPLPLLAPPAWAQNPAQQPAAPTPAAPRDTTPPAAYFGVTEYQLARQKLELDMQKGGFTVYIIADMEGLASAVRNATEMRPVDRGGTPQHERFRKELTDEVNAVIAGARSAGATQFIVNEGHGGTLFRNVLVDELDPEAILIRGYPKPIVMSTGLNPMVDAMMIVGAHANAGSPGVIAHNFAFDSFTVNGKVLNEVGINALIAGELGVSVSLVSGDDVLIEETKKMLPNGFVAIVTKRAVGHSAAITYSPARVRRMLQTGAAEAVRRERRGELKPLTMERPYRVEFALRQSYPDSVVQEIAALPEFKLEKTGTRSFRYVTDSARKMGWLLDAIEETVIR
jgi:D-amino peptidase